MQRKLRVWDLPTRLFHWALAACVVGSLVSVNLGGNAVAWHFRFGYAILTLLLFRLAWGFVGPRYARFASFPPRPAAALGYLRRAASEPDRPGHSPLGALSVYALLLALAVQVGTGLFANDAIMWDGPLKNLVSNATSDSLTRLHKINRFVLVGLVLLHLAAIAFYALVLRRNLVRPMLTGDLPMDALVAADATGSLASRSAATPGSPRATDAHRPVRDDAAVRLKALAILVACAALVWGTISLAGRAGGGV
jgi:cytochrome b